eukprot:426407-Pleurochrysis_carterae.AAC.1
MAINATVERKKSSHKADRARKYVVVRGQKTFKLYGCDVHMTSTRRIFKLVDSRSLKSHINRRSASPLRSVR